MGQNGSGRFEPPTLTRATRHEGFGILARRIELTWRRGPRSRLDWVFFGWCYELGALRGVGRRLEATAAPVGGEI